MPKLPSRTARQVIRILEHHGFHFDHATGSHHIFYHPESKRRVTVPFHQKDLPKGTLSSILKQAGLSTKDVM